ncbi:phage recombination protein Bet [Xenorhabdus hominickii]|uniref:Phage recombination protein Bet n=1 Tax=Xenorhabdus hominickii TaxID=351679 RepID=A0A2G0QBC3_XENHO|nr:phage recombination protein Bet [Xenorhabdus hominickii]AOM40535.1 phage recombination protein Bet [Xenorhabdus hominickii]PHM56518.1 phage recombination protein Bet [Xenorhabdus hominickii]
MSTALVSLAGTLADKLGMRVQEDELIETLKATAFRGNATEQQFVALLIVANQYNLNPWTKEVYAFPDKTGIVPVVGVDGWARIINENKQFDGVEFSQDAESCTCKIYRKDRTHPTTVTEYMSECKRTTQPWQSHPKRMLRHKAMIQCARLAFGFAGIYDQDEAERIAAGTTAEVVNGQESHADRQALISRCEEAAKMGMEAFEKLWVSLSLEEKRIIGNTEKEHIKETIAIEAEYSEVTNGAENG